MMTAGTKDWTDDRIPQFKGKKAFVLPGAFYSAIVGLMVEAGFTKAGGVEDADVVVFAGGADINPSLYNDKNVASGGISDDRDSLEVAIYHAAKERGTVMFGICRGAQFLHAMNGGKLWQDVNNHSGPDHMIVDIETDERVMASSLHHQMLIENSDITVVAVTEHRVATEFKSATTTIATGKDSTVLEIEAGAYPESRCFFVQGHPEVGSRRYQSWCMTKLQDFYLEWTGSTRTIQAVLEGN